jgi:dCMP deaminase
MLKERFVMFIGKDYRPTKDEYYLNIARSVALRSTCLRRNYGSVIVNHDRIISTGYNGAPRNCVNCNEYGYCIRVKKNVEHNSDYSECIGVHSEQNAIIHADYLEMQGATLYLAGIDRETGKSIVNIDCCPFCKRMIINAGIDNVVMMDGEHSIKRVKVYDWISEINNNRNQLFTIDKLKVRIEGDLDDEH